MTTKKNHLESLRGIAALSVAVYHFEIGSLLDVPFTGEAWLMVDFFFVLSGYVISLSYADRLHGWSSAVSFQKKRFFRLYPLHVVMLLVFVGLEIAKFMFVGRTGAQTQPAFVTNDLSSFVQNLFLAQALFNEQLTWNQVSWSLSAEFYTYILFAALLVSFGRRSPWRHFVILMLVAWSATVLLEHRMSTTSFGIYRCIYAFFIGAIAQEFEARFLARHSKGGSLLPVLLALLLVVFVSHAAEASNALLLFFPVLAAALILSLNRCHGDAVMLRMLEHPWLVFLGTVSYGIYMIHTTVWWVFRQVLRFVFHVEVTVDAEGRTDFQLDSIAVATGLHLAGLALTVLLAYASYRFLEEPILRRFAPAGERRPDASAQGVLSVSR
ncbi:acyltransferase family protein [Aestuariivirga sp.]|uniref:acyltransferase family protein n=1 Tax=Aestuariivirga sp. TaxID=2650926 RepID=UPI00391CA2C1